MPSSMGRIFTRYHSKEIHSILSCLCGYPIIHIWCLWSYLVNENLIKGVSIRNKASEIILTLYYNIFLSGKLFFSKQHNFFRLRAVFCCQVPGIIFLVPFVALIICPHCVYLINSFSFHVSVSVHFTVPCYVFHVYICSVIREIQAILLFKTLVLLAPFQYFFGWYASFGIVRIVILQMIVQIQSFAV